MIKIALFILAFILSDIAYGQTGKAIIFAPMRDTIVSDNGTGTTGDTIVVDTLSRISPNFNPWYDEVYLMVHDTGATGTVDSIAVEVWSKSYQNWIRVGVVDMNYNTSAIATFRGTGVVLYRVNIKYFDIIRARLTNSGAGFMAGRRVLTQWVLIKNN